MGASVAERLTERLYSASEPARTGIMLSWVLQEVGHGEHQVVGTQWGSGASGY